MKRIRLLRYMGFTEMIQYLDGKILTNNTRWDERARKSTSVGFCFFEDTAEETPEERLEYLRGVVNLGIVAIFETSENNVKRRIGRYRDPKKDEINLIPTADAPIGTMIITEYCTKQYSRKEFQMLKLGCIEDEWENKIHWIWESGLPISATSAFSKILESRGNSSYEDYIKMIR